MSSLEQNRRRLGKAVLKRAMETLGIAISLAYALGTTRTTGYSFRALPVSGLGFKVTIVIGAYFSTVALRSMPKLVEYQYYISGEASSGKKIMRFMLGTFFRNLHELVVLLGAFFFVLISMGLAFQDKINLSLLFRLLFASLVADFGGLGLGLMLGSFQLMHRKMGSVGRFLGMALIPLGFAGGLPRWTVKQSVMVAFMCLFAGFAAFAMIRYGRRRIGGT